MQPNAGKYKIFLYLQAILPAQNRPIKSLWGQTANYTNIGSGQARYPQMQDIKLEAKLGRACRPQNCWVACQTTYEHCLLILLDCDENSNQVILEVFQVYLLQ